jgi:hypothetical protein
MIARRDHENTSYILEPTLKKATHSYKDPHLHSLAFAAFLCTLSWLAEAYWFPQLLHMEMEVDDFAFDDEQYIL